MSKISDSMRPSSSITALACFLLFVVPLVVYCAWTVPLGQVPDEPTQVARIDSVLRGEVIGHRIQTLNPASGALDAGVTGNFGLVFAVAAGNGARAPLPASASAQERLAWAEAIPWSSAPMFISSVNTAAYAPVAYVPAALALGIAISLGAKPHAAAIAARFGNAVTFTVLGCLALLLATRGRILILVTLGLPMTVWLAGSCNQDGILIAAAALAIAVLTRTGRVAFWTGTALLAVLALQKPPFAALFLLLLAAPAGLAQCWRQRITAALCILVPAALWSILVILHVSVPLLPSAPYHPGPLWPGDPSQSFHSAIASAQLSVILHHPLITALLPLTKMPSFGLWLDELIGLLGPFDILLPQWLYTLFTLALLSALGALLTSAAPIAPRSPASRCWAFMAVLIALLGCMELIYAVQYLTWTPVGFPRIDGVQGRYFLPLLPVLALLLGRVLPMPARFGWVWWILPLIALIALDIRLPGIIAQHYYDQGLMSSH